ncbi:phage tail protein [Sansalvadorimonas verongulae]|uniref:phage tail protein n=1 Tax=Sansalvadorimonas verongulae TaxID=2172824 RepID=UPI0012BBFFB3|nr:phage tail protein [Sansalvadorimonas verongulae]MTI13429.1 phage tail protein [Sansalvadorimonas verongulae]
MQPSAKLGNYVFGLTTASIDSLSRSWAWQWANQNRLGNRPVKQFGGIGDQTISLPGIIIPGEYGEADYIERIAAEADSGHPLLLVTNVNGVGKVLGYWSVTRCQQTSSQLDAFMQARQIDFTIGLSYYGDRYGVR